jgi:hypothetical protein
MVAWVKVSPVAVHTPLYRTQQLGREVWIELALKAHLHCTTMLYSMLNDPLSRWVKSERIFCATCPAFAWPVSKTLRGLSI